MAFRAASEYKILLYYGTCSPLSTPSLYLLSIGLQLVHYTLFVQHNILCMPYLDRLSIRTHSPTLTCLYFFISRRLNQRKPLPRRIVNVVSIPSAFWIKPINSEVAEAAVRNQTRYRRSKLLSSRPCFCSEPRGFELILASVMLHHGHLLVLVSLDKD